MFLSRKKSLEFGIFFAIIFASGPSVSAPFSQYGMIQNVQNYSANPFYNPQTGTITAPNIVYATGPKLQASDCQRAVASVVENVCASRNNCQGTVLTDIRPAVMVQLSVLPNYNYASSCGGYIDAAYENYMRNFSGIHNGPSVTSFPSAPTKTNTASNLPQWQQDYNARAAELRELQSENGGTDDTITKTEFPKTFNDLTMAQQNEIKRQGYAQYKDARVYVPIEIETETRKATSNTQKIDSNITTPKTTNDNIKSNTAAQEEHNKSQNSENSQTYTESEFACIQSGKKFPLFYNYNSYFCYKFADNTSKYGCFKADTNSCQTNTTVCILGTNTPDTWKNGTDAARKYLPGYRNCAIAYATNRGGDDEWRQAHNINDCNDTKWARNDNITKTSPVMVRNNTALIDSATNKPMEYFVKQYNTPTYPNICIGYYCPTSDGKYREPNTDGTCDG